MSKKSPVGRPASYANTVFIVGIPALAVAPDASMSDRQNAASCLLDAVAGALGEAQTGNCDPIDSKLVWLAHYAATIAKELLDSLDVRQEGA